MMRKTQPGFVIILALLIISLGTMLLVPLVNRVAGYTSLGSFIVDREQAKLLALSGIEIAIAQLSPQPDKVKGTADGTSANASVQGAQEAIRIFETTNYWQQFNFAQEIDGVDGSCEIYIACEHGKINLNELYDFKKKKYIQRDGIDGKKIVEWIGSRVDEFVGTQHFAESLDIFLKKRKKPIEDISELLHDGAFKKFLTLQFPDFQDSKGATDQMKQVFLTDLFSSCSGSYTIEPLLFSRSLIKLLGVSRSDALYKQKKRELLQQMKNITFPINWEQQWNDLLANFYDIEYNKVPEVVRVLFTKKFEPSLFSVISCGKVGRAQQQVCALLEKNSNVSAGNQTNYIIKRLYWL